jgi:hypothetical protein
MRIYGQYCPIARGAEIFAERWTPLIIRNLYLGCGCFSEIPGGGGRRGHNRKTTEKIGKPKPLTPTVGRGRAARKVGHSPLGK